jgi:hypothetical protein
MAYLGLITSSDAESDPYHLPGSGSITKLSDPNLMSRKNLTGTENITTTDRF